MAAIGFSAGDVMSAITFLTKVFKALRDVKGASAEYESTFEHLNFIKHLLELMKGLLDDYGDDVILLHYVEYCCRPVNDLQTKIQKYESTFIAPGNQGPKPRIEIVDVLRKGFKQVKWALWVKEEALKILSEVNSRFVPIVAHNSMLQRRDSHQERERTTYLMSIVLRNEKAVNAQFAETSEMRADIKAVMKSTEQTNLILANPKRISIGRYVVTLKNERPELREVLELFWWALVLVLTTYFPPRPTMVLDTNILFTDAFAQTMSLAFEDFRIWNVLMARLDHHFLTRPGTLKVMNRNFGLLVSGEGSHQILSQSNWEKKIFAGAKVKMVMFVMAYGRSKKECPNCGSESYTLDAHGWSTCDDCPMVHKVHDRKLITDDDSENSSKAASEGASEGLSEDQVRINDDNIPWDINSKWVTDFDVKMQEEEKDFQKSRMVQRFTEPCDRCRAAFMSLSQLNHHLALSHADDPIWES